MPIYQYKCQECGQYVEELYKNFEESPCVVRCSCGGVAQRIIAPFGFKVWHYDDFGDAEARAKRCGVPI